MPGMIWYVASKESLSYLLLVGLVSMQKWPKSFLTWVEDNSDHLT